MALRYPPRRAFRPPLPISAFSCYAVVNLRFCPETTVPGFSATGLPISSSLPFSSRILGHASPFYSLRSLVGSNGLEPSTSRLSGVCSNQLSYEPMFGGGNRIRTDDPLLAGQVLYQLSYTPVYPTFLNEWDITLTKQMLRLCSEHVLY